MKRDHAASHATHVQVTQPAPHRGIQEMAPPSDTQHFQVQEPAQVGISQSGSTTSRSSSIIISTPRFRRWRDMLTCCS